MDQQWATTAHALLMLTPNAFLPVPGMLKNTEECFHTKTVTSIGSLNEVCSTSIEDPFFSYWLSFHGESQNLTPSYDRPGWQNASVKHIFTVSGDGAYASTVCLSSLSFIEPTPNPKLERKWSALGIVNVVKPNQYTYPYCVAGTKLHRAHSALAGKTVFCVVVGVLKCKTKLKMEQA